MSDKSIIRTAKSREKPYVMLTRALLHDKRLSLKGKGLLSYLLSLPDDWSINVAHLCTVGPDGRDSIQSGVKELVETGYLTKTELPRENGRFSGYDYMVHEQPIEVLPIQDAPKPEPIEPIHRDGFSATVEPQRENRSGLTATVNPQLLIKDLPSNELLISESALEKKSNVDFENLPAYTPPKPEHQSHRTTWSESGIESLPTEWIEKAREDHPSLTKEQALQTFNALDDYYTNERPSERGTDWFKKFKNWVGRDITNNRAKSSPSGFSGQGGANGHAYAQNATERQTESPRPSKHLQQHIAFAGLELYTFNSLLAVDPSVTQKAVRQMATDQGLDVIKLMFDLTKQAKADAV